MPDEMTAYQGGWIAGMNSMFEPSDITPQQYAYGENIVNRGGIIQTRPGLRFCASIPGKRLQGFHIFTPNNSRPIALVAVDGVIWQASPPYTSFTVLPGLSFDPSAYQIVFCSALRSTQQTAAGLIQLIDPVRCVIIQDGISQAGYYDGVTVMELNPNAPTPQTPVGLWMAWSNSRLWVARGNRIYASDLADPTTFTETTYLSQQSSFALPDDCTGVVETPDHTGLLAFTATTTTALQVSIIDRTQWQSTKDFQSLILPSIGCVSGFSPVNQYGLTYWYTQDGLTALDSAFSSLHSSRMTIADGEMVRSRSKMSDDLSGVSTCAFGNMLLVSAPVGSRYNAQTWVLDQSAAGENGQPIQAWAGAWSGFRPVKWATTQTTGSGVGNNGPSKCFCACYDETPSANSKIHIWEAFRSERTDGMSRISCQWESGAFTAQSLRKFKWVEFDLCEMWGEITFSAWIGGRRGPWIPIIQNLTLKAERGCINNSHFPAFTKDMVMRSFKRQCRLVRSPEFSSLGNSGFTLNPETGHEAIAYDKVFTVLCRWQGQMAIHSMRLITEDGQEKPLGNVQRDEADAVNIVNESGDAIVVP